MLSKKSITAWYCAEDQILKHFILRNRFFIFVLNDHLNNFLKSGNQTVDINYGLGQADKFTVAATTLISIITHVFLASLPEMLIVEGSPVTQS